MQTISKLTIGTLCTLAMTFCVSTILEHQTTHKVMLPNENPIFQLHDRSESLRGLKIQSKYLAGAELPEELIAKKETAIEELSKTSDIRQQRDMPKNVEIERKVETTKNIRTHDIPVPGSLKQSKIKSATPTVVNILPPQHQTLQPKTKIGNISGSAEIRFDQPRRIKQWDAIYINLLSQTNDLKHCVNYTKSCKGSIIANWADQIRPLKSLSANEKLQAVNNLVNRLNYSADSSQHSSLDHWSTPIQFLSSAGDCEDFAILKFASLMALGLSNEDLRIVIGNIKGIGSHAFLAARINGDEFLLDNRTNYLSAAINRYDFEPKHSFNFVHRWAHVASKVKRRSI